MLRGWVERVLSKLCVYFEGVSRESVIESLWKGSISLDNLTLKPAAIEELGLAVVAKEGKVKSLKVVVPWSFFGKRPLQVIRRHHCRLLRLLC
eukprot:561558-Rhodomonas_salina.1